VEGNFFAGEAAEALVGGCRDGTWRRENHMQFLRRFLFAMGTMAALAVASTAPASARSPYDGVWGVQIVTHSGSCPPTYRSAVRIVNGIVYGTDPAARVSGRVSRGGSVRVTVSSGSQSAYGSGHLSSRYGSGRWSSPAGCAGSWQAQRAG
jgi:hypothetical protein